MAELDTQLTLEEVARQYGVPPETLIQMSRDGIIRAVNSGSDQEKPAVTVSTVAAAANIIRGEIKPEQYEHLRGRRIQVNEAAKRFGVSSPNMSRWVEYGYIQILDRRSQYVDIDVADVQYVVDVFQRAKELTGSSIRAGWVLKRIFA